MSECHVEADCQAVAGSLMDGDSKACGKLAGSGSGGSTACTHCLRCVSERSDQWCGTDCTVEWSRFDERDEKRLLVFPRMQGADEIEYGPQRPAHTPYNALTLKRNHHDPLQPRLSWVLSSAMAGSPSSCRRRKFGCVIDVISPAAVTHGPTSSLPLPSPTHTTTPHHTTPRRTVRRHLWENASECEVRSVWCSCYVSLDLASQMLGILHCRVWSRASLGGNQRSGRSRTSRWTSRSHSLRATWLPCGRSRVSRTSRAQRTEQSRTLRAEHRQSLPLVTQVRAAGIRVERKQAQIDMKGRAINEADRASCGRQRIPFLWNGGRKPCQTLQTLRCLQLSLADSRNIPVCLYMLHPLWLQFFLPTHGGQALEPQPTELDARLCKLRKS